jgi:hypothetical protein
MSAYMNKHNYQTDGDFFTFSGTREELESALSAFMAKDETPRFISKFRDFNKILGEGEFIDKNLTILDPPNMQSNMMQFLLPSMDYETNYNINIKAATLTIIALLLDINLTLGASSAILALTGFNSQAIVKIDISEGEKCIILEAMQSKGRLISDKIFKMCNSECVHNDLKCKYQSEGKCTIEKEDIYRILDELCNKNIFRKFEGSYKYNF